MGLFKFLKKFLALKKSMLSSNNFKNNFKVIKTVCKNNPKQFGRMKMFLLMTALFDFSLAARIFVLLLWEFLLLSWDLFSCWENFSFAARIVLLDVSILFSLRELFWCCENSFYILTILLLLWEFFSCSENFSFAVRICFLVASILFLLWEFFWYSEKYCFIARIVFYYDNCSGFVRSSPPQIRNV